MKSKITLLTLLLFVITVSSCKKIIYETESSDDAKLSKITVWDTKTDKESIFYEVSYNDKGAITAAKGINGDTYTTHFIIPAGSLLK